MRELKIKDRLIVILTFVIVAFFVFSSNAQAGTLTVNTNADSNVCDDVLTLREAMLIGFGGNAIGRPLTTGERNQISGATFASAPPPLNCSFMASYWSITSGAGGTIVDNIVFSNGVTNILVTSGLPNITWAEDVINGLKGDGTKAAIDGTAAGSVPGLRVIATVGFTIRNLIIKNFQYEGILVEGADNSVFEGLEIHHNGRDGIALVGYNSALGNYNSTNNRIGGTSASQRNFIYSNGQSGISIITTPAAPHYPDQNNVIENNYIGLKDNTGNADFGNGWDGIYLEKAFGNRIGGDTAASRNVISGNEGNGIWIRGGGSYSNRIVNNFIGTNKDGNAVIGNTQSGVAVSEGAGRRNGLTVNPNMIGDVGQGNVIAGNYFGIALYDSTTSENIIRGNFIGTDLGANLSLGNVGDGIAMGADTHDNTIGGAGAGEGNVIAYNTYTGIFMDNGFNNSIRRNRIFLNGGLGIDLGTNGVTVNDPGDFDTGPNNLQNFPLIGSGSSAVGFTNLSGSMGSTANTAFTLDFFVSPDRDPSNYGEGSTYIGSATVTTDNFGFASFNSSFNTVLNYSGFYATATATDASGNTSEFSPALRIGCNYSISPSSQNFGVAGGSGSFNLTTTVACDWQAVRSADWITITGGASGTGSGTVSFSVAANAGPARTGTITVGGRIFTITQASSCTYELPISSASYSAGGIGNDAYSVFAPAGCTWTAVSNVPWVTVTSYGGSGNGGFFYSVAANTGPARQGTITAAGLTFTINQASGCTYSLVSNTGGYPASGGNDANSVFAPAGCTWTAVSNVPWVTITSGSSGNGNGSVTWSVAANAGAARQGTLTIAGLTFTINQAASCSLGFTPSSAHFSALGGNGSVNVTNGAGCTWTATSTAAWITITSGGSGTGNGTVNYSVAVNNEADRTGTINFGGQWMTITQGGGSCSLVTISPQNTSVGAAGANGGFNVSAQCAWTATSNANWITVTSGGSGTGNGTVNYAVASNTGAARSGTITVQSGAVRTFTVNQAAATTRRTPFDFDGDGKTDISIFRPSNGSWWYVRSSDGQVPAATFGSSSDKLTPGDFTGDGKTDIAFWQPSTGYWYILRSEDGSYFAFPFGSSGDIPAPADYDGDGKADPAVFRPSNATWYISLSAGGTSIVQFGASGDAPVVADYDGDGKADIAVFRQSDGSWWILRSSNGSTFSTSFGNSSDKAVAADYTGDGKADIAVWRPSTGFWYVLRSEDLSYFSFPFGGTGDIPAPGDYDGDGKTDAAVFRPSETNWYILRSGGGTTIRQFGLNGDKPVPSVFIP